MLMEIEQIAADHQNWEDRPAVYDGEDIDPTYEGGIKFNSGSYDERFEVV